LTVNNAPTAKTAILILYRAAAIFRSDEIDADDPGFSGNQREGQGYLCENRVTGRPPIDLLKLAQGHLAPPIGCIGATFQLVARAPLDRGEFRTRGIDRGCEALVLTR